MNIAYMSHNHRLRRKETMPTDSHGDECVPDRRRSIENWMTFWKRSNNFFDRTTDRDQATLWNDRWHGKSGKHSNKADTARDEKRAKEVFGLLTEAGFRPEGARVLDIGSGAGALALPFARAGAIVTALDVSKIALEKLKADADREGLFVETVETSWWQADIDRLGLRKKFDLVLVTSSPAVKDPESFDRMMLCSRDLCYYSFHIRSDAYTRVDHEDIFRNVLNREPKKVTYGKGSFFINGFMYIYLLGHRPLLRIAHHEDEKPLRATEAAERELRAIERFDACTEEEKKKVRAYFCRAASEGQRPARPGSYTGMMVWAV